MNTTPDTPLPELNPDLAAYFPPPELWQETLSMGADALRREKRDMILQECRILTVAALARRVLLDAGGDFPDTDPPLLPELPRPFLHTPPERHLRMMLAATRAAMLEEGQGELAAALERLQDAATYPKGPEDAEGRSLAREEARAVLLASRLALLKVRHWRGVLFGLLCGRLGMEETAARMGAEIAEANARAKDAEAEMYKARGRADAETEARQRAEEERQRAEEERSKAEARRAELEALAEERKRELETLQHGLCRGLAENTAATRAAEAAAREEGERTRAKVEGAAKKLEGRKRGLDTDKALVQAFQNMENAVEVDKEDAARNQRAPKGKGAIADTVIAECGLSIQRSRFLRLYDGEDGITPNWFKLGCPDTAEKYARAKADAKKARRKAKKAD